ncbi:MAG: hypothetical protein J4F41_00110 [Alphaproteobacteria bacterium]|nr:hypothetical protein [Alphaproteobacteria bacterium]
MTVTQTLYHYHDFSTGDKVAIKISIETATACGLTVPEICSLPLLIKGASKEQIHKYNGYKSRSSTWRLIKSVYEKLGAEKPSEIPLAALARGIYIVEFIRADAPAGSRLGSPDAPEFEAAPQSEAASADASPAPESEAAADITPNKKAYKIDLQMVTEIKAIWDHCSNLSIASALIAPRYFLTGNIPRQVMNCRGEKGWFPQEKWMELIKISRTYRRHREPPPPLTEDELSVLIDTACRKAMADNRRKQTELAEGRAAAQSAAQSRTTANLDAAGEVRERIEREGFGQEAPPAADDLGRWRGRATTLPTGSTAIGDMYAGTAE